MVEALCLKRKDFYSEVRHISGSAQWLMSSTKTEQHERLLGLRSLLKNSQACLGEDDNECISGLCLACACKVSIDMFYSYRHT